MPLNIMERLGKQERKEEDVMTRLVKLEESNKRAPSQPGNGL